MPHKPSEDPYGHVGMILDGRYEIERLHRMGGMAIVYRAKNTRTGHTVAVKVLKPDQVYVNPKVAEYFSNEARATANLNHRNIVAVYDAGCEEDGTAFLVMEFLSGKTLDEMLLEAALMPMDRISALFDQLCEGVDHAHSHGILHRDLKPGNIMIVKDDRGDDLVKILDFGIAKAMTATAKVSTAVATIAYASPEQLTRDASIDHRSDVYSLGVILYQMLVNSVPFDEDSHEHVVYQKMNFVLPSMRQMRPEIPLEVEDVIRRALAREPERRFPSATELARAFRRAIDLQTGALELDCLEKATRAPLAGISIILNGRYAGQTDARGVWRQTELTPRQYLIEAEHPQYQKRSAQVRINSNESAMMTFELSREAKGELLIRTNASGALVEIDGVRMGKTNDEGLLHLDAVATGRHRVRLTHSRFESFETQTDIAVGEIAQLDYQLLAKKSSPWKILAPVAGGVLLLAVIFIKLTPTVDPPVPLSPTPQQSSPVPSAPAMPSATPAEAVLLQEPPTSSSPDPAMTFEEVLARSKRALGQRNYKQAVDFLEQAERMRPRNAEVASGMSAAYPALGSYYFGRQQYRNALPILLKAVRYKEKDAALFDQIGDCQAALRNYKASADAYNMAIQLGRNDAREYHKSGLSSLNSGAAADAFRQCSEALKRDRTFRDAYLCAGRAQEKQGQLSQAIDLMKKARDLNRNDAQTWYEIGKMLIRRKDYREAEKYVQELQQRSAPLLAQQLASEIAIQRSQ